MAETNLMTIIESVANEMFEKYLLSRLEEVVSTRLNKLTTDVAIHTELLSNPNVQAVLAGVPSGAQTNEEYAIITLTQRLNMAFREIEHLQKVLGVDSLEGAEVFAYPRHSVMTQLEVLREEMDNLPSTIEDSSQVSRTVARMVERQLDEQDFGQLIRDNFDLSEYEGEIQEIVSDSVDDFDSRVRDVVREVVDNMTITVNC